MQVRMPVDIDTEDQLLLGLTARQLLIVGVPLAGVWLAIRPLQDVVSTPILVGAAAPIAGLCVAVALVRRDGLSLDRYLFAAFAFARSAKRRASVPTSRSQAQLRVPVSAVDGDGTLDLGPRGRAMVLRCGTVSFALRSPQEQQALIAGFAGVLHSQTGPMQICVRTERVRLDPLIHAVEERVGYMPAAVAEAALDHAEHLRDLADRHDLLQRHVLLILRDPAPGGDTALRRRAEDTCRALAAAGSQATVLDTEAAAHVLADAGDPTAPRPVSPEED